MVVQMIMVLLIVGAWSLVAVTIAYGAVCCHDMGCPDFDFDNDVDQALAAVADIEAADCRLWELECGWQV